MYDEKIEALISAALADGVLTEKEKQVLFKRAEAEGIDLDEFEMVLDARLVELEKAEKEKAEKSAPKSDKYGDVRKCPVCGAMVPALAATCPECGYEFSGVDANLSSQKLANLLNKTKNDEEKESIITTFPIPNTKSDLFEFAVSLQSKINGYNGDAYYVKLDECTDKIKLLFPNDPIFKNFLETRQQKQKELKNKKRRAMMTYLPIGICLSLLILYLEWHGLDWKWGWKLLLACYTVPMPLGIFLPLALKDINKRA